MLKPKASTSAAILSWSLMDIRVGLTVIGRIHITARHTGDFDTLQRPSKDAYGQAILYSDWKSLYLWIV